MTKTKKPFKFQFKDFNMKLNNIIIATIFSIVTTSNSQADYLSDFLQKEGVTNSTATTIANNVDTTDKIVQNTTNQVTQFVDTTTLVKPLATKLNQNATTPLTTNQFNQLLTNIKGINTNLSTSDLAQKLNTLFGNQFTTSNTNQWFQLVNGYVTNHPEILTTVSSRFSTNISTTSINKALNWFKTK